jgi:hypothetical protein
MKSNGSSVDIAGERKIKARNNPQIASQTDKDAKITIRAFQKRGQLRQHIFASYSYHNVRKHREKRESKNVLSRISFCY